MNKAVSAHGFLTQNFLKIILVIPKPIANKIRPVFFDILKKAKI
jgi:hypothetical protein